MFSFFSCDTINRFPFFSCQWYFSPLNLLSFLPSVKRCDNNGNGIQHECSHRVEVVSEPVVPVVIKAFRYIQPPCDFPDIPLACEDTSALHANQGILSATKMPTTVPVVTTSLSRAVTASVTPSSTSSCSTTASVIPSSTPSCSTTASVSHSPSVKFASISASEPIKSATISADEPVKSANVSASESLLKSEKCQYKTKHIYLFSEHMREKHRIYKFDAYNFTSSSEKGLSLHKTKSHTQIHKDHSEYKCEKCRYTARDINNLKRLTHLKQIVVLNCCHTKPPVKETVTTQYGLKLSYSVLFGAKQ